MKVTAQRQGFFGNQFRNAGDTFDIPDEPTRRLTKDDDAVTRQVAVKGQVPRAFSSAWMMPGGPSLQTSETATSAEEQAADLNADVI